MTKTETRKPLTELEFIQTPIEWPRWPILPVVKRNTINPESGLVWAGDEPEVITGTNLWRLHELPGKTWGEKLKSFERVKYASFEELLKVWRID